MREQVIERTVGLYCERFEALEGRPLDPAVVRACGPFIHQIVERALR